MKLAIIVGIIITFFLALILLTKKDKNLADKILAAWLVVTGVHLFLFYDHVLSQNFQFPKLLGLELPMPFLQWPLLYIYISVLTNQYNPNKKLGFLWHFVPALLLYIYLVDFFSLSIDEKISVFKQKGELAKYETFSVIILVLMCISGLIYTYFTFRLIRLHRKNILNQFSYQEKINLNWVQYLFIGMGLIWMVIWFRGDDNMIFLSVVVFVIFLGYFGIKQVGIFTNKIPEKEEAKIEDENTEIIKKYEKSSLTHVIAENIHQKLLDEMTENKYFQNPELSLNDLATTLGVHPNILSQVINTFEGKTFFDYINYHRVEEFKKIVKLPDNQKYTLLGLAYDCGFNSKTSFNRNFKKATGFAPSEYLKQLEIDLQ